MGNHKVYEINVYQRAFVEPGSIKIRDIINRKSANPIGVVSILPEFQIRIGQKFSTMKEMLRIARIPVIMQTVCKLEQVNMETYSIIRMGAGKIPEVTLGFITVSNGIIICYQYNTRLTENLEYRKQCIIPAMQQVKIPNNGKSVENAVRILSILTNIGNQANVFQGMLDGNKLYVGYTNRATDNNQINYFFNLDRQGAYRVTTVGYKY